MAKTKLTRTPNSNRLIEDANLQASNALFIPVNSSSDTNGNALELGAIRIHAVSKNMQRYDPAVGWVDVGVSAFQGKFPNITALRAALPVGQDGWYAIVTASPHNEEWIWDSDSTDWVLTTNTPASSFADLSGAARDNADLAAELAAHDAAITAEAATRAADDATIQAQVSALSAALIPHPAYTAPTAGISSTQTTGGLEIGQTINIPLTATFNQNDGGASTALSIKKNGTQIATASPYTDSGVTVNATPIVYNCNIAYAQGPIKNNILGIPDATGRIGASNANSSNLSYQGFYKIFYDAVSSFPTDSATARALSNIRFSNSGNAFTLNTGSTLTKFCIILPPGKTLSSVIDQDALNLDITSQYTSASITVNDAAGTPVTGYTIWSMSQSVPYSSNHRHNITIA